MRAFDGAQAWALQFIITRICPYASMCVGRWRRDQRDRRAVSDRSALVGSRDWRHKYDTWGRPAVEAASAGTPHRPAPRYDEVSPSIWEEAGMAGPSVRTPRARRYRRAARVHPGGVRDARAGAGR